MKRMLAVAAALFLTTGLASAKTHSIPDDDPIATITFPDSWDVDDLDDGIEVTSKDEAVYVAVEAVDTADVKSATAQTIKFFKDKGVKIDEKSQQQHDFKIGGMDSFELGWKATDDDGPTNVSLTIVGVSDKKMLFITYWASDEAEKNNSDALAKIINSVQATKK